MDLRSRPLQGIEKHAGLLGVAIAIMVSFGGLAEIVPWGSKRTGPDLARIGGKYSDQWHRLHLIAPRDLVPESNMPNYPWLATAELDDSDIQARMRALRRLGDPYSDADIAAASAAVKGKSELDALVAYLQGLGVRNAAADAQAPTQAAAP